MPNRIPYFYIIEHVNSGKYYAGVRHGKGCTPDELLKDTGYKTSSKYVHALINEDGLSSFIVNRIRTFLTIDEAIRYEQRFLSKVDAMNNDAFINMSNGGSITPEALRLGMLRLHGVDNYSLTDEFKEKYKATCQATWGVDHYTQTEEYKEKYTKTVNDRYEVDHYSQTDEFKEKVKATTQLKHGVDNYSQTDEFKEKSVATCQSKWGVDNYTQTDEYKARYKQTMLEKHGVDNYSKTPEFKEKLKEAMRARCGHDHYTQTAEFKEKLKRDSQEKWGVDSYMSTDEFRRKSISTSQKRWGVDNYTQSAEYKEKYSGKNAINFKGYYITPHGIYTSRHAILKSNIKHLNMNFIVNVYTKNQLYNTVITRKTYNKTKYLNVNYNADIIGMTYRELGFTFVTKESLIPLISME